MRRVFKWLFQSLFAPVTGTSGAVASSLGFFLSFLPVHSLRIPLLLVLSLVLRLNIIALFLGTLIPIFTPFIRHLPFLNLRVLEGYIHIPASFNDWVSAIVGHKIQLSRAIANGVLGGTIGLACYFFFQWFYNLGLKKEERNKDYVFLDPSKRRWSIIKRVSTGFAIFIVLVSVISADSLFTNPVFPKLQLTQKVEKTEIVPINEGLNQEQLSFKNQQSTPTPPVQNKSHVNKQEIYGFYVNWDKNSKTSFEQNINSITTLIPEWVQLHPDLSFTPSNDQAMIKEATAHHIKILPMVNNIINNQWDSNSLHRLFTTSGAEDLFIQRLLDYVEFNHFSGINIDFENINPNDKAAFTHFMDKLSQRFHQHDLMVTMDVPPHDNRFDYASLSNNVDRMIVMLYDQHDATSQPGPVAPDNWVIKSLEQLNIPSDKLIVSLGSYGYDWTENSNHPAKTMTFEDIVDLGKGTNLKIHWDKQDGNPYFRYKVNGKTHIVWFLDAASFYNQMKTAIAGGSKGIALWRLGSEDPSIWHLLKKPGENEITPKALKTITSPVPALFTGAGEIVKVRSQGEKGKRVIQTGKNGLIRYENYTKWPKPYEVELYGKPKKKEIVLSFDDGPSPTYTSQILDILNKNHIKGTFFIVGRNAELHPELVKKMFNEGHEIGNHTFTHPNIASVSPLQTKLGLNATQRLFQEITGHSMTLFRPPYTANASPSKKSELEPVVRAQNLGYTTVEQSIDSNDWRGLSSDEIVNQVLSQLPNGNVILFHDGGGNRANTVKALPMVIKELKKRGYQFTTVSHLIGKSNEEMMPPVSHEDSPYMVYDKAIFTVLQNFRLGLSILFYSAILLGILRLIIFISLSLKQIRRNRETEIDPEFTPFVSVVIAAYNEEKVIGKTVNSILASSYPAYEVLVIDDGSKDDTAKVIQRNYANHPLVRLIKKANGGKSSAVNLGFKEAKGEIVVSLDADTIIDENAITLLVNHFKNENVAAVSGNVKVGNIRNLLTKWQHIEYVTGFNLERRAFAALNCITVVPGAIGAWRKTAVEEAGYFKNETLAEDTDITLTLLRHGKKIEFEEKAYAYTEVPEDIKSLAKQRYRWVYGTLQCLWKHREALFNKKYPSLGFIGLPSMWLFQYFYQLISPIADILFVIALFSGHPGKAVIGFILFYLLDFFTSLYAFRLEKEDAKPLISLFLQRILYKQIMTYVVFKSLFSAIKGVTVGWNKLKRKGNVNREESKDQMKEII